MKSGNLNFLEPSGPLQACNGTALPFTAYEPKTGTQTKCIPARNTHKSCIANPGLPNPPTSDANTAFVENEVSGVEN
jgi:hypothetical protein